MEKLSTSIWVYLPAREKGHTGSLHGGSPDVKLTERDEQCKGIYERGKDQKQATAEPAKTLICLISRAYIVPTRKKMGSICGTMYLLKVCSKPNIFPKRSIGGLLSF